jgi:hypothetical protein
MSTVKSKKLQVGTDATSSNNFTIYQPATPDGTLRIGVGNADSPTEVGRFDSNGYVATNAPAFSAYINVAQSISATTYTKIQFDTEHFDTNSNYDTTTYRFTPTVAGYYQINFGFKTSVAQTRTILVVYKNGAQERGVVDLQSATGGCAMSCLLYMNGSTDYIEPYAFLASAANSATGSVSSCFDAFLARAV